ncbi:DNA-directed DNA polymerase epsilon, subunit B [Lecanora helva]
MESQNDSSRSHAASPSRAPLKAPSEFIPSSSPAFNVPVHHVRVADKIDSNKPSILPIILPPGTLRPLAFRTITKKHNLTLTSTALQLFATFIGKHCGSGWREEGLAEKVLDEAAKRWKKSGGGLIVAGEGSNLKDILHDIGSALTGGKNSSQSTRGHLNEPNSERSHKEGTALKATPNGPIREDSQTSPEVSSLSVETDDMGDRDPKLWLRVIGAFDQPRLTYNVNQKHFEVINSSASLLPDPSRKIDLFRHRLDLVHQRLLRNESFQTSSVAIARIGSVQGSSPTASTAQQAYKLTPIANLLGRTGSSHLLLGLLTVSPTGTLTVNDMTGSIGLDMVYARPTPEDGAWFAPGMIVLVDGVYEEEGPSAESGLDGSRGVGGRIGGKFIAFSIGGPPCERREISLGITGSGKDHTTNAGGGFGWVDFLGVGSERASGSAMRKLEMDVLKGRISGASLVGRSRIIILGEVQLDNGKTLQALKKILGLYAADQTEQTPMSVVLMGNFVQYAVMSGGGSGGSIEYKEYFDSLASTLSEYPTLLQTTTFVFVPGDNDPWAAAFSAGAATPLPKKRIPELFTSRVKRAFAAAIGEKNGPMNRETSGEVIWSTNPTRISLFGPSQELVLFRDDLSGRLRRNAVRFRSFESPSIDEVPVTSNKDLDCGLQDSNQYQSSMDSMEIDSAVQTAESNVPAPTGKEMADSSVSADLSIARKLVKTILDQGHLSPFPLADRPILWDLSGALQLYPLPTALVLMDPEAPPFAITYEGCHVMNPGPLIPSGKRGVTQWMEYDAKTRRGRTRELRF